MDKQRKLTRKEKIELSNKASANPIHQQKTKSSKNKLKLSLGLIVALFGFLLYIQTVNYTYTLDDYSVIKENFVVKQGVAGIGTLLHTSYRYGYWASNDELYRPLSLVMFAIEWQFFPDNPSAGHFINILLYAITGFFLFKLLCRLFNNNLLVSFIASMLFMAHPVHTEVVANIKSGDEILCLLFSIVSINFLLDYLQSNKMLKLILSAIAFFLATMAKENAITLLAVIPVLLFVFKKLPIKKSLISIIPLGIAALTYIMIRNSVLGGVVNTKEVVMLDNVLASAPDFITRFATAMYVLGRYLLLLIFPVHLADDYSYSEIVLMKFSDYRVIISTVIYLAIAGYAVYKIRKKDVVAFGILFYLITIFIVSNLLVIIGTVMADRLLFLPSLGFCLIIAYLLTKVFKAEQTEIKFTKVADFLKANTKILAVAAIILALYSFKTITRNPVWYDNMSLYVAGVEDSPNSCRNHYLLGIELKNRDAVNEKDSIKRDAIYSHAIMELQKAIDLYPPYFDAYRDMGLVYYKRKDTTNAFKCYNTALKYNPHDDKTWNNKGVIIFELKRYNEALNYFAEAVKWNPRYVDALKNLGSAYGTLGKWDEAINCFLEALKYAPNDMTVINYLGMTYGYKGDKANAAIWNAKAKEMQGTPAPK